MNSENIVIKETTKEDITDILEVEKAAFGNDEEAELSQNIIEDNTAEPVLSLLAYYEGVAVGHVLFSKVRIEGCGDEILAHLLAPLAVRPEYQKKGIGKLLVKEGFKRLKTMGSKMVFVLGHKEYYPRFGFTPFAESLGFPAPYPIPEKDKDAWMIRILSSEDLTGVKGKVLIADALDDPKYWTE